MAKKKIYTIERDKDNPLFKRYHTMWADLPTGGGDSEIFNEYVDATDAQRNTALANVSNQTANSTSGKIGYKVLDPTKTFAEQVTAENTIYEIRDVFDLNNSSVTIPTNCTLKFNGGKLNNGTLSGDFNCTGEYKSTVNNKVFTQGFNLLNTQYIVVASEIGMIENDSSSATINGNIFARLVAKKKSIKLDGIYYIGGTNNIDYSLSISGGKLLTTASGFLRPLENASISITNCIIKPYDILIYKENLNYLIDTVIIENCTIINGSVIRLYDNDADVSINKIGIKNIIIKNNIFENIVYSCIVLSTVCYNSFSVSNNIVNGFKGSFVTIGRGNQATYGAKEYYCDIIVSNNNVKGGYINADFSSYCTFLCATVNVVYYENNTIKNIIKTYQSGYPAYDAYVNSNEYYCVGNHFKNIVYVPLSGEYTSGNALTEIMKSKGGGKIRHAENNIWEFDFTEILAIINDNGDAMTEEQLDGVADVVIFNFVNTIDNVIFKNNTIDIKGGYFTPLTSSVPVKNWDIVSNTIKVDKLRANGHLVPFWNSAARTINIINNYIVFNNLSKILFLTGSNYSIGNNTNCDVCIKENTLSRNIYITPNGVLKSANIIDNSFIGDFTVGSLDSITTSFYTSKKIEQSYIETDIICGQYERNIRPNNTINSINKIHLKLLSGSSETYVFFKKSNQEGSNITDFDCKITVNGISKIFRCTYDSNNKVTLIDADGITYIDSDTVLVSAQTIINRYNIVVRFMSSGSLKLTNNSSDVAEVLLECVDSKFDYFNISTTEYNIYQAFESRPKWWNKSKWVDVNGYTFAPIKGDTASRPTNLTTDDFGFEYADSDLGKKIMWNGTDWVNLDGTALS